MIRTPCILLLTFATTLAVGAPAAAQSRSTETSVHGPRFLMASADASSPVRMDPGRLPILRKRISVRFDQVTIKVALDEISAQAGLYLYYSDAIVPLGSRISLDARDITVAGALTVVLLDAGVDVLLSADGHTALVTQLPEPAVAAAQPKPLEGSIAGRVVTDASPGAGVGGASVTLEGTRFGAVTGNTGRYQITDVPAGTYTVVAQQLGYAEARRSVTVRDGAQTEVDFTLEVSALPMDEIVATGTAFSAKVRSLPNPISVITAEEIEEKQSTNITDLLRGEIPGAMPLAGQPYDYLSHIYVRGNAGGGSQDLVKIYIDGVEVANAEYLSTIDPKSIERIEMVRGPQASAIYGSEAASGVLQIFTKKGRPGLGRPRIQLQASSGVVESDYIPPGEDTPLTHDYALELNGGGESFSYRAGASYVTLGEWVKHYASKTLSFSGGLRALQGPLTAELTVLWSDRDHDFGNSPIYLRWPEGACPQCGNPDYHDNRTFALSQNTMGLKLAYQATPKWQHMLILGDDQNRYSYYQEEPSMNTPSDTFTRLNNHEHRRRSIRYHTAYDAELSNGIRTRFTGGLDYWSYDVVGSGGTDLYNAFGTVRVSPSTVPSYLNDRWWNFGYFGMTEFDFHDQLFLTAALRVEDNPNLGEDYGLAFAPRLGASYVRELGSTEIKLRGQWGKGIRPPSPTARNGRVQSATLEYIANANIAPEEKVGWDAGVELHWGNNASLAVTRFDETAKNLIQETPIDLSGTPRLYQLQNIGVVDIEGWELEGSLTMGRVTLEANYLYSDTRVREVSDEVAANPTATLQVGDRTFDAPKHSGGGSLTARIGRGTVTLDGWVMSGARSINWVAFFGWLYVGDAYRGSIRQYYEEYPARWKWNLRAEQALTNDLGMFMRVDNLTNNQEGDLGNFDYSTGRTTVIGIRWTL